MVFCCCCHECGGSIGCGSYESWGVGRIAGVLGAEFSRIIDAVGGNQGVNQLRLPMPKGGMILGPRVGIDQWHQRCNTTFLIMAHFALNAADQDRKSTRLNSSHVAISYAVFCLKKQK